MKDNIVLIGMPGAGKSTLGVLIAKALNYRFVDTDLTIQENTGELLCETIERIGTESFLELENEILRKIDCKRTVIATGGSAVYGEEAMRHLHAIGTVVYINLSLGEIERRVKDITTRGVVMKHGKTLADAYAERTALYSEYADIVIDCDEYTIEESVEALVEELKRA